MILTRRSFLGRSLAAVCIALASSYMPGLLKEVPQEPEVSKVDFRVFDEFLTKWYQEKQPGWLNSRSTTYELLSKSRKNPSS